MQIYFLYNLNIDILMKLEEAQQNEVNINDNLT